MTVIDVQPSLYFTGAAALYTAATDLFEEVQAKYPAVAASSSMAGSYDEAKIWATGYDAHAAAAIDTATALADTMDKYARAMRTLGYNHQMADWNATTGTNKGPAPDCPADPPPAVTLCDAPPPSAGGPGNGLSDVVHLAEKVGITIPDGDTGKLGAVGDAWLALAQAHAVAPLPAVISRIVDSLSLMKSPEVDTVVEDLKAMQAAALALGDGFADLAKTCHNHATALHDLRGQLEKQLEDLAKEIIKEIGVGLAITVVTSMVTFGIGAIIEAVRVAKIVEDAAPPIKALVDLWKSLRLKKDEDKAQTLASEYKKMQKIGQKVEKTEKAPEKPAVQKLQPNLRGNPPGWTDADSTALSDYTGSGYKDINEGLREGNLTADQASRVDSINTALSKLPDYQGTVVRGTKLPPEVLAKYQEGATVTEDAFTSSSRTADGAFTGGDNDVVMQIVSKTGKDVSQYSTAGTHEEEVLFGSKTPFKVTRRIETNGKTYLFMEEQ